MSSPPNPRIPDLRRHVPPGVLPWSLMTLILLLLLPLLLLSWARFHHIYGNQLRELCTHPLITLPRLRLPAEAVLREGAVIAPFAHIIAPVLSPFRLLALPLLGAVAVHYGYYSRDSKSVYLMARLPSRWELHYRAWALPLAGLLLCLAAAGLLALGCYGIYLTHTPPQCLPPVG